MSRQSYFSLIVRMKALVIGCGVRNTHGVHFGAALLWITAFALSSACKGNESAKAVSPATVANAAKESDLTTVTLTEEAEKRLGLQLATVERRMLGRARTFGGEVVVPTGRAITVAAPVAGTIMSPESGFIPTTGSHVGRGQPILRLLALPTGADLVRGEEGVTVAEVRLRTATAQAKRYEQLIAEKAVTQSEYEQVEAERASADAALRAARARLAQSRGTATKDDERSLTPLTITAPQDGIVNSVNVGVGQSVASSAPLFEIVKLDRVWIRVPVYVGDLVTIAAGQPASIHGIADSPGGAVRSARPIGAPPSADANSASANLFFELSNLDGTLRPGQKVGATLPLKGETEESLVVPWSAVVVDISGGAWVYENIAPHAYARRRVEIKHVTGDLAVLTRGPTPGTKVVSVAAAELFGTEFGIGK